MAMAPAFWSSSSPKPPERTTIAGIPAFFAASTSHTESPIITLDASGGVPSFFSATCSRSGAGFGAPAAGASAGAAQHEPVTTFLDGYEQVAGTGQRRYLLEQRVDLLALLLPGLISHPALQVLTSNNPEHVVPAHPDKPVQ